MKLTDVKLRSLKAESKPYKLSDGDGLFIWVSAKGAKRWRWSYRFLKKQKTISLGPYPEITLSVARKIRADARALLAQGIDPDENRKEAQSAASQKMDRPTWKMVALEYRNKRNQEGVAQATMKKLDWSLDTTYAAFGNKAIAEIRVSDLLPVMRTIEEEGKYEKAKRLRSVCDRVFQHAVWSGYAERNVAKDLAGVLTSRKVRHQPAVTEPKQVGRLLREIRLANVDVMTRAGLELAAYCFLRPGEIRYAEWGDVDWQAKCMTIPAERMKKPRPHIVPLAPQALKLLNVLKMFTGEQKHIFASATSKGNPISENTLGKALQKMGYKGRHVPHGFRRTASTILNEKGWNRDWIERQLAHVERDTVRAAYNAAEYLEDRTRMMAWYANYLDDLAGTQPD